jgi:hypothetical protein
MILPIRSLLTFAGVACLFTAAEAGIAYQSESSPTSGLVSLVGEFGNQLILKTDSDQPLLSSFSFAYESNYAMSKGMILRFYANDGGSDLQLPGTLLYQSSPLDIKVGRGEVSVSYNSVPVPKTFTFTVEFLGNDGLNSAAGLLTPNQIPTVGQAYNDIWLKNSAGWQLRSLLSGLAMMTATVVVNDGPGLAISPVSVNQVKVTWKDATYKLQRSDKASPATWTDVTGITGTSATLSTTTGGAFFRVITR